MKTFLRIYEQNEILNRISNDNKGIKEFIIENNKTDNIKDFTNLLMLAKESLEANGKLILNGLQTDEEKLSFFEDKYAFMDPILSVKGIFSKTPVELGYSSIKQYILSCVDVVVLHVINQMLEDLK